MKVWKFKKHIEIDKTIGNFHIETFHYGSFENDKPKHWTELHCWYECDCEHCPLSWEVRGYDDVDCGCYAAEYGEDYPKTSLICMLPRWIKKILLRHKAESEAKYMYRELLSEGRYDNATEYAQLLAFAKAEFEEEVMKEEAMEEEAMKEESEE